MKRLGQWRGAWLLAPGLLSVALCAGNAIAQEHLLARSPAPHASAAIELSIWRTISLGTTKGVNEYSDALDADEINIGNAAYEILGRSAFCYARARKLVELVVLSAAELGVEADAASHAEVYRRAKQMGLELCPAEVGPRLRLEYRNQPLGEALDIAMEPISTYAG